MYIHLSRIHTIKRKQGREAPALPCACANLRRAARAVTHLYDRLLRPSGLRAPQFTLLQVLGTLGEASHGRLGKLLVLDSTTLTRTLRHLRARSWIEVQPGKDRRERWVRLTPADGARLNEAQPHWEQAQLLLCQSLGGEAWRSLLPALARVTTAADEA